jgi:hypothetical protein
MSGASSKLILIWGFYSLPCSLAFNLNLSLMVGRDHMRGKGTRPRALPAPPLLREAPQPVHVPAHWLDEEDRCWLYLDPKVAPLAQGAFSYARQPFREAVFNRLSWRSPAFM